MIPVDEIDAADIAICTRTRVARVLRTAAAHVAGGRFRVTSRSISLLRMTLEEMLHPEAVDRATEDPAPVVDSKPPLPPLPP